MAGLKEERIGDCTLYNADCMSVLPMLEPADLLLTDPPYGIARDKGMGGGGRGLAGNRSKHLRTYAGGWDAARPSADVFAAMLNSAGQHIVWGGNYFTDMLPVSGKWLFWDKCQTMPSFSDGEMAWTTLPGDAVKQFTYNGSGLHAKEKHRVHPTQKPVALMEWCLGFAPEAETVLDCYLGSGTTLVACAKLGRKGIGIELDPDYFAIACRRVEEAYRQPDLFVAPPPKPTQEAFDV